MSLNLSAYDYKLPQDLIAQYPCAERTHSRLLVMDRASGALTQQTFYQLVDWLHPHDLLVFNNTKVIPARAFGYKATGGKVEILVERVLNDQQVLVQLKASRKPAIGSKLIFADFEAQVVRRQDDLFVLAFSDSVLTVLEKIGHVPLPPYINRADERRDQDRYQTVYAKHKGAVAAPTAGLHFDQALLNRIRDRNIKTAFVTLHVGVGTFQPIRVENIAQHQMHSEWISVDEDVITTIQQTQKQGGRVIAVGTTTVRCLETAALSGELKAYQGDTDIFIYPGFEFKVIDGLITNFHLPKSTLLLLVSAFASREKILHAYRTAVLEKYRFFSYGDAMLIL